MVGVLKLASQFGRERLRTAVESALETGCTDPAAVEHLLRAEDLNRPPCDPVDVGLLEHYHRPLPVMTEYDQLLATGAVSEYRAE